MEARMQRRRRRAPHAGGAHGATAARGSACLQHSRSSWDSQWDWDRRVAGHAASLMQARRLSPARRTRARR